MADTVTVAISEQETIALPPALMQSQNLKFGDTLILEILGRLLVLRPKFETVNDTASGMENVLVDRGNESPEPILQAVRENRIGYK